MLGSRGWGAAAAARRRGALYVADSGKGGARRRDSLGSNARKEEAASVWMWLVGGSDRPGCGWWVDQTDPDGEGR